LHRRIERLLDDVVQPVDLVDEEDLAALEVREDRREVARALEHGTRRRADADRELVRDHVRERRLPEAGRAVEEHAVEDVAARARGRDLHAEVLADRLLADVLVERARTERRLDDEIVVERVGGDRRSRARHPARPWSAARTTSSSGAGRPTRWTARSAS